MDENMTICDCCGTEIPVDEANYVGPEIPAWEGATLCNDCYAVERVSDPHLRVAVIDEYDADEQDRAFEERYWPECGD
jgi:hypothetical protein